MTTLYLDLEGGSDAADGTSFANRKKTWASMSAIASPGDTVRVMGSPAPVSLGVNGIWATGDYKMTLSGAVNADIADCNTAWTTSGGNVTVSTSTTRKEGALSASIAILAGFSTGMAAYFPTGTIDLSGYQQVSFWLQQTAGTLSGNCSIKLCSDAAGATPVDTLTIPACVALNAWHPVVIDKGSALGSSIQSIALYVDSDLAAQTFLIDNVVACKAPAATGELTHRTLIGKANSLGAGGDDSEPWYAIRAIRTSTVYFDQQYSSSPLIPGQTYGRYFGPAETVSAYSQVLTFAPAAMIGADGVWLASGASGSPILLSGGWNRTDMSTQTVHTWWACPYHTVGLDGLNINASFVSMERMHFARWSLNGLTCRGAFFSFNELQIIGCNAANPLTGAANSTIAKLVVTTCATAPGLTGFANTITLLRAESEQVAAITGVGCSVTLDPSTIAIFTVTGPNKFISANGEVASVPSDMRQVNSSSSGVAAFSRAINCIGMGTVHSGASTTVIPTSSITPADAADKYVGRILMFTNDTATAALRGQATDITSTNGSGELTVTALTATPASGDVFVIQ